MRLNDNLTVMLRYCIKVASGDIYSNMGEFHKANIMTKKHIHVFLLKATPKNRFVTLRFEYSIV